MVLRSAGEVGCAHCKRMGADRACQVCTRLVCETCGGDWATCDQPSGRVVRLGLSARVRDIDPLGKYALVSHWRQPLRVFDLRALAWVPNIEWERRLYLMWRKAPPRLTASGWLIYPEGISNPDTGFLFRGMRRRAIADGRELALDGTFGSTPAHGTAVSTQGSVFYYVTTEQRVMVIPENAAPAAYEPLPRKVIHAVHIDGERMLMLSASWGEFTLHHIDSEHGLVRLAHVNTDFEGNVHWVGVAGEWIAVAVGGRWEMYKLRVDRAVSTLERRYGFSGPFGGAAMSRDGRYLAVAGGASLHVVDLDTDTMMRFDEHSDAINAVRFAREDHVLISADTDNRLILRPRTATGYAKPLLEVKVR